MTRRKRRALLDGFVPLDHERHGDVRAELAEKIERAIRRPLSGPAPEVPHPEDEGADLLELLAPRGPRAE